MSEAVCGNALIVAVHSRNQTKAIKTTQTGETWEGKIKWVNYAKCYQVLMFSIYNRLCALLKRRAKRLLDFTPLGAHH